MKNNDKNFDEIPSEKPNKKINILRVNEKPKHEYKNIYLCPLNKHDAVNSMEILDDFIIYGTIMGNVYLCRINTNNSNNSNNIEKSNEKKNKILNLNEISKNNNLNTTSKKEKTNKKFLQYPPKRGEQKNIINYLLNNNIEQRHKNIIEHNKSQNNNNKNGIISKINKTRNNNDETINISKGINNDNSYNKKKIKKNNLYKAHSNKNSSENNNYNHLKTEPSVNYQVHKRNNIQFIYKYDYQNNISMNDHIKQNKLHKKKQSSEHKKRNRHDMSFNQISKGMNNFYK